MTDPQPPFLIADASSWQGEDPPWRIIEQNCVGLILKATQGMHYAPDWFVRHWQRVRDIGGERYGQTWLRGAYHYLDFYTSGTRQADRFLAHVAKAGGWDHGDIMPIVDVERGGANQDAHAQQVVDCVQEFAAQVKHEIGRNVILYGRGAMRDLAIRSKMGCVAVWNPGELEEMPLNGLTPTWKLDEIVMWQYSDGKACKAKLPPRLPGWTGGLDLSVYVDGANKPTLESLRARLL